MWSFILAGFSSLAFIVMIIAAGMNAGANQEMLGVMFMLLVFVPSVSGFGIGLGAVDRRFANPGTLWAAVIWNGVILGGFLLLTVVGLMQ